jgi:hypothetical protein
MGPATIDEVTTHALAEGWDALRTRAGIRVRKPTRDIRGLART